MLPIVCPASRHVVVVPFPFCVTADRSVHSPSFPPSLPPSFPPSLPPSFPPSLRLPFLPSLQICILPAIPLPFFLLALKTNTTRLFLLIVLFIFMLISKGGGMGGMLHLHLERKWFRSRHMCMNIHQWRDGT